MGVDGNQGFTLASLERLMPVLHDARVQLIEQPLPIGEDEIMGRERWPIPLAADESLQDLDDLPGLVGRFEVVNLKLDKCGGLTAGLAMVARARQLGLQPMVGCMAGTSLAMAPAFILGQLCDFVDLDAPLGLATDRVPRVTYESGHIMCPPELWGTPITP
jgi:L-alanine-DL-glutamate epimerase-like enolase superfamily enzyme